MPDFYDWQPLIRNKPRREALAKRFRDAGDPLQIVLVRDMWLTGFDAPSLHTMYVDKPMRGHGLMQAIARVNRVFKDKPGGLVVDYLGLAHELKRALATYIESGGTGKTALDQEEAVAVMLEKYEICGGLFHGFDRSKWTTGTPRPATSRAGAHPGARERQGPLRAVGARSEHGLVSEEAVLNARLLSVARLLLPLPSPDLANPLKRRFTLRPGAVGGPRRQRRATRGDHNHDVLCTGRAGPIVDRSGVVGPVRRETPDGNFERGEKIRECGGVVPAARGEFGRHHEPLRIHSDVQLPPIPAFL